MHYGFNKKRFINSQELKSTESERNLGVIFANNLEWKNQVISCVSKANQTRGIIRNSFAHLNEHCT